MHENYQSGDHEDDDEVINGFILFAPDDGTEEHGEDDPARFHEGFGGVVDVGHCHVGHARVDGT